MEDPGQCGWAYDQETLGYLQGLIHQCQCTLPPSVDLLNIRTGKKYDTLCQWDLTFPNLGNCEKQGVLPYGQITRLTFRDIAIDMPNDELCDIKYDNASQKEKVDDTGEQCPELSC